MNRKYISVILIITSIFFYAHAQENLNFTNDGGRGNSIAFDIPTVTNQTSINDEGLAQSVKSKLQENWNNYSNIDVVAADQYKEIIKTQKKSTKSAYDESKSITAGKMIAEQCILYTEITIREGPVFEVSCRIVDITTGKITATFSSKDYETINDIYEYAANDIATALLPRMNVDLSSYAVSTLKHRDNKDKTVADAQRDYDAITQSISDIEKQLNDLEKSGLEAQSAQAKKVELEARQRTLEQDQQAAKERLEQRKQDEAQRNLELIQEKNRSTEMKKKIASNSIIYDRKATKIKKDLSAKISTNTKLTLIEQKKSMLIDIRKNSFQKIDNYDNQIDEDCEEKIEQVDSRPFKTTELRSNGKPTSQAKESRKAEKKAITGNAELTKNTYNAEQMSILQTADLNLCTDINTSIEDLSTPQTVNSLNDMDMLRFGNYDGAKEGWTATVSLVILNQKIAHENIFIPYKNISGKDANLDDPEYEDNVDEYSSYFNRNIPFIYVEITYHLTPANGDSQYTITLDNYTFYRIDKDTNDSIIYTKKASVTDKTLSLTPALKVKLSPITLNEMKKMWGVKKEKKQSTKNTNINQSVNTSLDTFNKSVSTVMSHGNLELSGFIIASSTTGGIGASGTYLFPIDNFEYGPKVDLSIINQKTTDTICLLTSIGGVFGAEMPTITYEPYWQLGTGLLLATSDPYAGLYLSAEAGAHFATAMKGGIELSFNTRSKCDVLIRFIYQF